MQNKRLILVVLGLAAAISIIIGFAVFSSGKRSEEVKRPSAKANKKEARKAIHPVPQAKAAESKTVVAQAQQRSSTADKRAREVITKLRQSAKGTKDPMELIMKESAALEELKSLGREAITAMLAEIADPTSPQALRVLLIEMAANMGGRQDGRIGQALMAIISDAAEAKAVRMQALQWIPATADPSAGKTLLEMLRVETDKDIEFGLARALRGFQVPGSVEALKTMLVDDKSHLTRIATYHALAAQGGQDALAVLQNSVAARLAKGSQENLPRENAVLVHGVLALGELGNASSLPILESAAKNPANSVSVRNTALKSIAAVGGADAVQILRRALQEESNESVLVYVAQGLAVCGDARDASECLRKAATITDSFTKSELERTARELQGKATQ